MGLSRSLGTGSCFALLTVVFACGLTPDNVVTAADRQSTDKVPYPDAGPRQYKAMLPLVNKMLGALPEEACPGRVLSISSDADSIDKLRKRLAADKIDPSDFDFVAEGRSGAEDVLLGLVDGRVARVGFYYPSLDIDTAKQRLLQFKTIQWDNTGTWGLAASSGPNQQGVAGAAAAQPTLVGGRRKNAAAVAAAQTSTGSPTLVVPDDKDKASPQQWYVLTRDGKKIYAELSGVHQLDVNNEPVPIVTRKGIITPPPTEQLYLEPSLITIGMDAGDWYTMHHKLSPAMIEAIHQKRITLGMTKVDAYIALIDYRLGIAEGGSGETEKWTWYVDKKRAPAWMASEAWYGMPIMTSPEQRPTVRCTAVFRDAIVQSFVDH